MGIASIIALAAGIGFLFSLRRKINEVADREGDEDVAWSLTWGARLAGLVAVLGLVGFVDSYVYKLPNPFDGPAAELPEKHRPEKDVAAPEIKKVEKPDPMKDAKNDHQDALEDFKKRQ